MSTDPVRFEVLGSRPAATVDETDATPGQTFASTIISPLGLGAR
jgi:hypothetical protein